MDVSKQDYVQLVTAIATEFLDKDGKISSFFQIITITMGVVEHLKLKTRMTGREKKDTVFKILPDLVDILVSLGYLSLEQANKTKEAIKEQVQMLDDFIENAVFLSNHPDLINAGKFILKQAETGAGLCGGCVIS
jgi:hypothetical protein